LSHELHVEKAFLYAHLRDKHGKNWDGWNASLERLKRKKELTELERKAVREVYAELNGKVK